MAQATAQGAGRATVYLKEDGFLGAEALLYSVASHSPLATCQPLHQQVLCNDARVGDNRVGDLG
jgi:hypothetical protein